MIKFIERNNKDEILFISTGYITIQQQPKIDFFSILLLLQMLIQMQ
jgi:hypothetical protein